VRQERKETMLRSIIRKEILLNLLSYKFSIITILSTMLILVSIFVMYGNYRLALDNHDALQAEFQGRGPVRAQILAPTPLGIFAKGLDENLCRAWRYMRLRVAVYADKQKSLNDLFKLFTAPDLLYVIKVILSLCAMLFAFDVICGEKETGTLRQSLSNNLKRPTLILGKWIGGFVSFILPFFIVALLGTIFVTLLPMVQMNAQDWAKLGLFLLSAMIYLAVFFSLGLLISCLTHRSCTSLVLSLSAWTILVFLIPHLGNLLARQVVQIPTPQQLNLRHEQLLNRGLLELNQIPKTEPDFAQRQKALTLRYTAEARKLDEDYRNCVYRLVKASQNLTRLSPAPAFTLLATDIMGTGVAEERKLKTAVESYNDLCLQRQVTSENPEEQNDPPFHYQRSSIQEVLGQGCLSNCLILILFNALFFTGAYVVFLRYDAR
jgi:ABC-type transport system involved in multi-copper enzyme maturation permease subunit